MTAVARTKPSESARRRRPVLAEVAGIYSFRVPGDRFGACQVVAKRPLGRGRVVEVASLDYLATSPPTPEQAASLRVFRATFANWDGKAARCNVDERVPWWLAHVTTTAPLETFPDACNSYGHWQSVLAPYFCEIWMRGARRRWTHDKTEVSIDLGGGAKSLRRDVSRVDIGPGAMFESPVNGPPNFEPLDALPCLTGISYTGSSSTFVDYVVSREIPEVTWLRHGQRSIDLGGSHLTSLRLDVGDDPVTLRVPATLLRLTVSGNVGNLTLEADDVQFPFRLVLEGPSVTKPPTGSEGVQCLEYSGLIDTDTANLSSFTRLAELTLRGGPRKLRGASGLRSLSSLRELDLYDLYDLRAAEWPTEWPSLDVVRIQGLRKADADPVKAALRGVPVVRIISARTDEWIQANLDNPFRDWGEDDAAFGRAACHAWRKAKAAATKLGATATAGDAESILKGLVLALNRLNAKVDIDTIRREEAGDAFFELARTLRVDDAQAMEWFDAWRDF